MNSKKSPRGSNATRPKSGDEVSQGRPNILCLCCEDGPPNFGAYGDELAHTPTIDRLASQGLLFLHNYTTQPVCGPSRFAILTGMYPQSAAAEDFGTQIGTLPYGFAAYTQIMREAGYYCTNNAKRNYNSQFDFVDLWDETSRNAHWKNRPAGKPFFAVFNGDITHESCVFKPLDGRVTPEQIQVPKFLPDTPGIRRDFASSYNYMEKLDSIWSDRLNELKEAGVAEETIVFIYSDHGGITPRTKRFCYEQGVRIPLIVYFPSKWQHLSPFPPGAKVEEVTSHVDLMPTILSVVGIKPPEHLHGRAYAGPFRKSAPSYVFSGRNRMDERYDFVRSASDGRYRYIRNYSPHRAWGQHVAFQAQANGYQDWEAAHVAGTLNAIQDRFWGRKPFEELYDVQADHDQVNNLVGDPSMHAKLQEMRQALEDHIIAINDNGFIPEGLSFQGYTASRSNGLYPLRAVMALAAKAAAAQPTNVAEFVRELSNDCEILRYWAAQGLLILGEAAAPVVEEMRAALLREQSVATRIALAEGLIALTNDHYAVRALGLILDFNETTAYRLQALSALTAVGERAKPVLPAIKRMTQIRSRHIVSAARHIIRVLAKNYDPLVQEFTQSGGVFPDPELEEPVHHG